MPKITINDGISSYLKSLRNNSKITVRTMAEILDKSPAYISKLEKGEIGSMDLGSLYLFIQKTCQGDEKKIANAFDYIYMELQAKVSATPEEIKEIEEYENFDKCHRFIPVPQDLKEYILNEIDSIPSSLSDIVETINQNDDAAQLKNRDDVKYNTFYYDNGNCLVLLKLKYEDIYSILHEEDTSCTYLQMQALLYTIFKEKGESPVNSSILAEQTLTKFQFYTLDERHKHLGKDKTNEHDQENYNIIHDLLEAMSFISDYDVLFANSRLKAMTKNINNDMGFALTYMTLDITPLKDISYETKKEFLEKIKSLIEEYSRKEKETDKIQTFDV